jgi:hypothetical protein
MPRRHASPPAPEAGLPTSLPAMHTPLHVLAHKHLGQPRGVRIEVTAQCLGDEMIKIGRATLGDKHPRIVNQLLWQLGMNLDFHGAHIGEESPQENRKTPRSNAAFSALRPPEPAPDRRRRKQRPRPRHRKTPRGIPKRIRRRRLPPHRRQHLLVRNPGGVGPLPLRLVATGYTPPSGPNPRHNFRGREHQFFPRRISAIPAKFAGTRSEPNSNVFLRFFPANHQSQSQRRYIKWRGLGRRLVKHADARSR